MCGIVGYIGQEQAAPILLDGLARLEYRRYDSAGIAVVSPESGLQVKKSKGRLQVLSDLTGGGACISGLCDAVSTYLKVDCHLAENPQECVARGCGLVLENWAEYGRLVNNRHHRGG